MLNEELREDLRAIATHGRVKSFNRDVTLISKLYNISSENTFRSVLNQVHIPIIQSRAAAEKRRTHFR